MAHQPTLKQLKYLCALAEKRHFSQAAKACHVSQSTLSAGIQELEQTLDVVLVERDNRNMLLTPLGEEVVKHSRDILAAIDNLVACCEQAQEPFSQKMRIGVIPTIAPFLLPKLLKKLRQKHPGFQLLIREQLSATLVKALQEGELDVLLLALPYAAEGTESMHLFYDDFLVAYPSGHAIANKKSLHTTDLKKHELLLLEDGHCLRDHAMDACKLKLNELSLPFQASSLNTIVQMVANDIGITLLPEMALASNILAGTRIKTSRLAENNTWRSIGLMWRRNSIRKQEFRQLGEFIQDHMQPHGG